MRLQHLEGIWSSVAPSPADIAGPNRYLPEAVGRFLHRAEIEFTLGAILWTTLIFLVGHSG